MKTGQSRSDYSDDPVVEGLEVYLVGGAVRDHLLGRQVMDRDWVVVGATPEQMRSRGFTAVGADFPVFLHPHTHEEFALARTERKTRVGHQGFEFHASPEITLEQDLIRRDFTINAMAMDHTGQIIDPYHGREALEKRLLVPVSDAFNEDPLRILRAARFMAQMPSMQVAPDFVRRLDAMRGELSSLSAERLWQEAYKAFTGDPNRFFEALDQWGLYEHLGLAPVTGSTGPFDGTPEQNLRRWLWQTAGQNGQWLNAWRAPKRWSLLDQDLSGWQTSDDIFTVLKQIGALKQTPRSEALLDTLRENDAQATAELDGALSAARAIRAQDMDPTLSGPDLGQALVQAQSEAFYREFCR